MDCGVGSKIWGERKGVSCSYGRVVNVASNRKRNRRLLGRRRQTMATSPQHQDKGERTDIPFL